MLPGDVARVILGREASDAALEALRQELGLNKPLPIQYLTWLGRFATGDWASPTAPACPFARWAGAAG